MGVDVRQEPLTMLSEHGRIPIAFTVRCRLDLAELSRQPGGQLPSLPVQTPYLKDYDVLPGNRPTDWPARFDTRCWGLLTAFRDGQRVGGAVVAHRTPDLELLEDQALLWDIRVAPEVRRQGIGSLLLQAAERWAAERGCRECRVETQDINLPAAQFYARCGYRLERVEPGVYSTLPDETRLIWSRVFAPAEPHTPGGSLPKARL